MARTKTFVTEALSPYKLAAVLSAAMTEVLEVETTIAPQQLYGAVRSGSLQTERFDSGHIKVTPEVANAFIQERIDRQLNKSNEAEEDATSGASEPVEVTA